MTAAMVATSIVFFPPAPLFLFIKGKDITIPKGTEVTAGNGSYSVCPRRYAPGYNEVWRYSEQCDFVCRIHRTCNGQRHDRVKYP